MRKESEMINRLKRASGCSDFSSPCVLCGIIVMVLFVAAPALPGIVRNVDLATSVREAEIIAVATVVKVENGHSRCSTCIATTLKPVEFLRGNLDGIVVHTDCVYDYKEAFWPWEKICPSVSYLKYPSVKNAVTGDRVIILLKRYYGRDYYVTATIEMSRIVDVRKITGPLVQ